ncbi:MAG: hypothetical protein LBU70_07765 [Chitinispirillales bacterium]|jgi:hypothetical protein|nr:hypothetical protein [Chitinispirillales bacterium]
METETQLSPLSQYRYFDRSFRVELALFVLFVPTFIALWNFAAHYHYHNGQPSIPLVKAAVYFTVMFIFARIFYKNACTIARTKSIILDEERISKKFANEITVFNCAELSGIRRLKIPLLGGRMILESPEKTFSIPICVRDGHEMIVKFFDGLEARGRSFENAAMLKQCFHDTAKRANIRHELRAKRIPKVLEIAVIIAVLNYLVERELFLSSILGILNIHLQVWAYFLTEFFHVKTIMKNNDATINDDNSFSGYYIMAGLIALLLGMIIGIAVTEPI